MLGRIWVVLLVPAIAGTLWAQAGALCSCGSNPPSPPQNARAATSPEVAAVVVLVLLRAFFAFFVVQALPFSDR